MDNEDSVLQADLSPLWANRSEDTFAPVAANSNVLRMIARCLSVQNPSFVIFHHLDNIEQEMNIYNLYNAATVFLQQLTVKIVAVTDCIPLKRKEKMTEKIESGDRPVSRARSRLPLMHDC